MRHRAPLVCLGALLAAATARAGIVVPEGRVAFEIRENGQPIRDLDVDIFIRTRDLDPPVVIAELSQKTSLELPEGSYDCIVLHHHILTHPLRFHRFLVKAGETTVVASDVRTHLLSVVPVRGGVADYAAADELLIENTNSGERLRIRGAGPVLLPEAQYRVRLRGRSASGTKVEPEATLFLACDQELALTL